MSVQTKKVTTITQTVTTTDLTNNAEADAIIKRFAEVKSLLKILTDEKETLDAEIRELMGDATVALINGVVRAEIKPRTRKGVDMDDLRTVFPEAYELCLKETPYTILLAE